jgi:PmbA protein
MEFKKFADKVFQKSSSIFQESELFKQENISKRLGIFQGELEKFSFSSTSGISLRGIKDGRPGYSYTEIMDDKSVDILLEGALGNAESVDSEIQVSLLDQFSEYPEIEDMGIKLDSIDTQDKIQLMLKLEKSALEKDPRIVSVQDCIYEEFTATRNIINSKGISLEDKAEGGFAYLSVVAKQDDDTKTGSSYRLFRNPAKLNIGEMAAEASDEALSMLGASPVDSGVYPVVIRFNVFAEILEAFFPIFAADNVQKGLSGLKGKLGENIASKIVTICDDPFCLEGFAGTPFDDEGAATGYKNVIDSGILSTYLYNTRSAAKENRDSTGNGFRASYKSPVSTSPTNFYLKQGDKNIEELLELAEGGLHVTMVAGLHSGLDTVSGDFSVQAQGYLIKSGTRHKPVNGVTISGNFFELLKNIEEIGNDLHFIFPGNGHFGSPSIFVKEASISGN